MYHATQMKTLVTRCLLVFGLALIAPQAAFAAPDIDVSSMEHDFGERIMGEDTNHEFIIYNRGDEVLKLENVKAGCGCTVPTGWDREIEPGSSTVVKVKYKNKNRPGKFNKTIRVTSNDPDENPLTLRIMGNILTEVDMTPRNLFQDKIFRDEGYEGEITLSTKMLDTLEVRNVTSTSEHIDFEVKDVPGDAKQKKVVVKVKESAPLGPLFANISIETNSEKQKTSNIRFSTTVYGDIVMDPMNFRFRPFKDGEIQTSEITISDRSGKGDFKVTEANDLSNNLDLEVKPGEDGNSYVITAKTKAEYNKTGHYAGTVQIKTNREDESQFTVNYSIFIRNEPLPAAAVSSSN